MRLSLYLLAVMLLFATSACQDKTEGTLIKGQLAGAEGLQVALDELMIGKREKQKAIAAIETDGSFKLGFVPKLEPGVYQLRIGAQTALVSVGDEDEVIEVNGNLQALNTYEFEVKGSPSTAQLQATMQTLRGGRMTVEKIEEAINGIDNPNTAAFVTYSVLGRSGAAALPMHQAAMEKLSPDNTNKTAYQEFIKQLDAQQASRLANERIKVGQPAPDIAMESPDGKEYKLSDLKGQVVLLDFWASWCRPCRAENPNVVKVYDQYKDEGFTIYSVSLDGLDSRRTQNMDAEQVKRGTENSKNRWVQAIEQDKLSWPYHVSELKKWDSTAGRNYGVTGIPKTFLIDREGKIAAVGLRGAASIERALKEVI